MSLRKVCRETQVPSKALFYFVEEEKTGIAPVKIILEKERVAVGNLVTVNWQGEIVPAEILALHGEF